MYRKMGMEHNLLEDTIRILHPDVVNRLGCIRHVLFDFDGTLSVLRQGWEEVMIPLMVESICGPHPVDETIEQEVRAYVDRSTGILTIHQMQWLVEAVRRYGLAGTARTAREYKTLYVQRLMVYIHERISRLACGESVPRENMVAGSEAFVSGLVQRGARLYLASGTDHAYVVNEASALNLLPFFENRVYGALDDNEDHAKERVIERILDENGLSGEALLVVGDGPVEIREGTARGAITLGVASNEITRCGWNQRKIDRLTQAGADLLIPDFEQAEQIIKFLSQPGSI